MTTSACHRPSGDGLMLICSPSCATRVATTRVGLLAVIFACAIHSSAFAVAVDRPADSWFKKAWAVDAWFARGEGVTVRVTVASSGVTRAVETDGVRAGATVGEQAVSKANRTRIERR
jgi:hypothetical protein